MSAAMDQFARVAHSPGDWLKGWKAKSGKKVIGGFPLYVPEELIHAAGMLPVVLQGSDKPITRAAEYLHSNVCHPVQGNFDQALRGEMDYVDGLVFADVCEQAKRAASLWQLYHTVPYRFNILFPHILNSQAASSYMVKELGRFKRSLEQFTGGEITAGALGQSIALYNRTRQLLAQLYKRRRQAPGSFTVAEMAQVMAAAQTMPKEDFNPLLEAYLSGKDTSAGADDRVPVLLACSQCEDLEPGMAEVVDDTGGLVVDDDLYPGYRYFATTIREDGDPIEALAQAHFNTLPCPTRHNPGHDWGQHMIDRARSSGAKGVVLLLQKFCEIHYFEYPLVKDRFAQEGMPLLMLETDHSGAAARVKTRLEAFLEMVKEA
jgi:benzoyl-CoA reductase subunit C